MAIFEPGKCDSDLCTISYIRCGNDSPDTCTFGDCKLEGKTSLFSIPNTVPIKTVLKGSSCSPWVRLRFEGQYTPSGEGVSPTPATCSPSGTTVASDFWNYTEITTGNISQPYNNEKCKAAIKSFQYGWGTVDSGSRCKITIADEIGSSLSSWIGRLFRNPRNTPVGAVANFGVGSNENTVPQGVYKMKVTFGWLVLGGEDGNECPVDGSSEFYGPASCTSTVAESGIGWQAYSDRPSRLICSPPVYFIPDSLNIISTNGRYIYEIEGVDAMQRAQDSPSARVYGSSANPIHLGMAIKKLASEANPPFDVDFLQIGPTGELEPLLFTIPANNGAIIDIKDTAPLVQGGTNVTDTSCTIGTIPLNSIPVNGGPVNSIPGCLSSKPAPGQSYRRAFERLGPLGVWPCHELNPLATIHRWLNSATAQGIPRGSFRGAAPPRGIVMNYDNQFQGIATVGNCTINYNGKLLLWANPHPHCSQTIFGDENIRAAYVVGGGSCSPVLSFNPNIKYTFLALPSSGGGASPVGGRMTPMTDGRQTMICNLPARGLRQAMVVPPAIYTQGAQAANSAATVPLAAHQLANTLHQPVEAELKVQGDPSDYYCGPIHGVGRTIALVVINPFYLDGDDTNGCNVSWKTLTSSSCNSILTNKHWFIKGVDHQINNGSFVTVIKLSLFAANSNSNSFVPMSGGGTGVVALGGEAELLGGQSPGRLPCAQGTNACVNIGSQVFTPYGPRGLMAYPAGPVGTGSGANDFCEVDCSNHDGPE